MEWFQGQALGGVQGQRPWREVQEGGALLAKTSPPHFNHRAASRATFTGAVPP